MLTKLQTYKFGIVITLILALSSVYFCQILCDLDIYSMNRSCHEEAVTSTSPQATDIESHVVFGHHHEAGSTPAAHDNHIGVEKEEPHSHSSNSDEGCCEEMTDSVVRSLIAQKAEVPSSEARLFFIFEIKLSTFQAIYNNLLADNFKFYYSDSSPPTIQGDIYVFVQSFLL